jgi:dTDP-4-amino-4,6-dideoxygalactose transaminase
VNGSGAVRPDRPVIPLARPPVDDEVRQAVLRALDSGQYVLGPECEAFEAELARYHGVRYAVLASSATAGLWMTLRGLGVKRGDEVLLPSHTAFPTVEAVCAAGAVPVFAEVDASCTIDVADAAARVTPRTVGVLPVHLYGHPADIGALRELCSARSLWLLEDCAQAQGAAWQGRRVGALGAAGVLSFYPSKNVTVLGDGGAVLTDDEHVAARCRRLRNHGRLSKDVHGELGFNLRFNDLQAAVGRALLPRLDAMNARRRALALRYQRGLSGLPLVQPREAAGAHHVYHLYVVRTRQRDALARFLAGRGVATGIHYPVPGHRQPAIEPLNPPPLQRTERLVEEILSLPMSAGHSEAEVDRVVDLVHEFFGAEAGRPDGGGP